jgi:hypothetical protein
VADWVTISSLATAGGTLVLAVATFSSVKSANRSARTAERALLAGQRPVLVPSRDDDVPERVRFGDGQILTVPGHGAALTLANDNVYMAIALRNGGTGLAVIHGWQARVMERTDSIQPEINDFRRQQRDLYIPAGDTGFWQGAIREQDDSDYAALRTAAERRQRVMVDLLYGDQEGGQRTISRFSIADWEDVEGERAEVLRYWNLDRDDPR